MVAHRHERDVAGAFFELENPDRIVGKESLPQKRQTRRSAGLKIGAACVFLLATTAL
jgi:hypothetical protein